MITRSEVSNTIKMLARLFGLPEELFSSKSLRKGVASHGNKVGMSEEDIRKRGGWSEKSGVPDRHYISKIGGEGVWPRQEGV